MDNQPGPVSEGAAQQDPAPAAAVRALARRALKASLATIDIGSGHPYASLVIVATDPGGAPVLLLSGLARHTRNLLADARASLLLDGTQASGDPLAGGRATLIGHAVKSDDPILRRRFLARHPTAADYADFADFGFWQLSLATAHWIGGFGRIVEVSGRDIAGPWSPGDALVDAEPALLARINMQLPQRLPAPATEAAVSGPWRATGLDRDGLDLVARDNAGNAWTRRLNWPAGALGAADATALPGTDDWLRRLLGQTQPEA